ncbi:MAG: GtrA family protein [Propionibacteriaceae bacterium]|nr:GtrA family protein [Propionibacteriaceae bacterium]HBY21805.1 GtrA family protein [Propionibacteriaceae bacterium]
MTEAPKSSVAGTEAPAVDAGTNHGAEALRYVLNGVTATFVNWAVMRLCLDVFHLPWAWLAYWVGALFGITTSFLGSRYFVFRKNDRPVLGQAVKFLSAYVIIALLASGVMHVWVDWLHLDSNLGFLMATAVQVVLSYFGNKFLVFT